MTERSEGLGMTGKVRTLDDRERPFGIAKRREGPG